MMWTKAFKPKQTFTMNNLFNQQSRGLVKYIGREFTEYEDLPPLKARKIMDWSMAIGSALGGLPVSGTVTQMIREAGE